MGVGRLVRGDLDLVLDTGEGAELGLDHDAVVTVSYTHLPLIQGEPKLPKEDSLPRFAKLRKVLAK